MAERSVCIYITCRQHFGLGFGDVPIVSIVFPFLVYPNLEDRVG